MRTEWSSDLAVSERLIKSLQLCKHLSENNRSMEWWSYGNNCPTWLSKSSHHDGEWCKTWATRGTELMKNNIWWGQESERMKLIPSFFMRCGRERKRSLNGISLHCYRCPFRPISSTALKMLNNFIFVTAVDPTYIFMLSWQFSPLSVVFGFFCSHPRFRKPPRVVTILKRIF